ncbi:hypothetical protein PHET_10299 [Paragonimus heterotremus]|uniref:PHTF1/2 N-terminal domain-containing protein n=1 Tax=Paragonimus heterotremus TaxID=100268 RepID=A0A8J4WLF1_9TREM|nr:hypothetical protein PHET_10299 [Paragonimus heterotremus]
MTSSLNSNKVLNNEYCRCRLPSIRTGINKNEDHEKKAFLIDVDVVRGSVFAKTKPRHRWSQVVLLGTLRAAFAPFCWDYWCSHLSFRWAVYLMFHFVLQFIQVICFLLIDPDASRVSNNVTLFSPILVHVYLTFELCRYVCADHVF